MAKFKHWIEPDRVSNRDDYSSKTIPNSDKDGELLFRAVIASVIFCSCWNDSAIPKLVFSARIVRKIRKNMWYSHYEWINWWKNLFSDVGSPDDDTKDRKWLWNETQTCDRMNWRMWVKFLKQVGCMSFAHKYQLSLDQPSTQKAFNIISNELTENWANERFRITVLSLSEHEIIEYEKSKASKNMDGCELFELQRHLSACKHSNGFPAQEGLLIYIYIFFFLSFLFIFTYILFQFAEQIFRRNCAESKITPNRTNSCNCCVSPLSRLLLSSV